MSELGFNLPPTTRSNGDGTSVERPEKRGIDLAIRINWMESVFVNNLVISLGPMKYV